MPNLLHRVLVVTANRDLAQRVLGCIGGNEIVIRTDFEAARTELDSQPPDLLVTEVRLGAFNGLHLALRARGRGLPTQTILIGEPDCVLENEAKQLDARYVTSPVDEDTLAATVHEMLASADAAMFGETPLARAGSAHGRQLFAAF
jgi:DNA-binding response OmpR family regulator